MYSTDLNAPIAAYQKQSQFALGGLVGYYFDRVSVQAYVTSDVYEKNYGGSNNISGNLRITIPLWNPPAATQSHLTMSMSLILPLTQGALTRVHSEASREG